MKTFNGKPVYVERYRYLRATLAAVDLCDTRNGLIEVYRSAKKSLGDSIELAQIVEACQKKTQLILDGEAAENAKSTRLG